MKTNKKCIMITGGHMTPAVAVISELKSRGWNIFYISRVHALEGEKSVSIEVETMNSLGITFLPLTTGRLQRKLTKFTFYSLIKLPVGLIQSFVYLLYYKPKVILSFGGYVALPVVLAGAVMGVPIVTHEQTRSPGLANKIIAYFARKICVTWEETAEKFDTDKVIVTGTPLRSEIFTVNKKLPVILHKPLIYITGGNLGSHSINVLVEEILPELLERYCVIHQCGSSEKYKDYERLIQKKDQLNKKIKDSYLPIRYIDSQHIGWVFRQAHIMISRSGANTVSELTAMVKPAILIPLPWSGRGEQEVNAAYLDSKGAARLLKQDGLIGEQLLTEIKLLTESRKKVVSALLKLKPLVHLDAAKRVSDVIESLV